MENRRFYYFSDDFKRFYSDLKNKILSSKQKLIHSIFINGNYNLDVLKFAIRKVLSTYKKNTTKNINFSQQLCFINNKINVFERSNENFTFISKLDLTMIISFLFVVFSILIMFLHFHLQINSSYFHLNSRKRDI